MSGGLAQMVERSLSMREVPGSMPGFSNSDFFLLFNSFSFFHLLKHRTSMQIMDNKNTFFILSVKHEEIAIWVDNALITM